MSDLLVQVKSKSTKASKKDQPHTIETRTFTINGVTVTRDVKVYKELKKRPRPNVRTKGRQQSDAKLVQDLNEDQIKDLNREHGKRKEEEKIDQAVRSLMEGI